MLEIYKDLLHDCEQSRTALNNNFGFYLRSQFPLKSIICNPQSIDDHRIFAELRRTPPHFFLNPSEQPTRNDWPRAFVYRTCAQRRDFNFATDKDVARRV